MSITFIVLVFLIDWQNTLKHKSSSISFRLSYSMKLKIGKPFCKSDNS